MALTRAKHLQNFKDTLEEINLFNLSDDLLSDIREEILQFFPDFGLFTKAENALSFTSSLKRLLEVANDRVKELTETHQQMCLLETSFHANKSKLDSISGDLLAAEDDLQEDRLAYEIKIQALQDEVL